MFRNPHRAGLPRLALLPVRAVCLDTFHNDPDSPCPYCDPDTATDATLGIVVAAHAQMAAEDAELFGWDVR
jgi:hypothetical protein